MNILDESITDENYWRALCPGSSITETPFASVNDECVVMSDEESVRCKSRILEEGYYVAEKVVDTESMQLIAEAIWQLTERGYPASFVFMYDEPWQVFRKLSKLYECSLGKDYQLCLGGIWAWNLANNDHGFSPHRDSLTNESIKNGTHTNLTVWVPVTDATADNGCMYVLPLNRDPNFPNNLNKIQMNNAKDIRALPASAGSALTWMQNVIHWGGNCSPWAKSPRLSIAASFSSLDSCASNTIYANDGVNSQVLTLKASTRITLNERLQIIASAIWFYGGRVPYLYPEISDQLLKFSRNYVAPDVRNNMGSNYDNLMQLSLQHKAQTLYQQQRYAEALPVLENICATAPADVGLKIARLVKAQASVEHNKLETGNPQGKEPLNLEYSGSAPSLVEHGS